MNSTQKSLRNTSCPWKESIQNPTKHRLVLARKFSQEGRKTFGSRWKGIYVIGSTASSFASPLRDVDVVPLLEKPEGKIDEVESERFRHMLNLINSLEIQTSVFIEVWLTTFERAQYGKDEDTSYLDRLREIGVEKVIKRSAVLLDGDSDLGLPEKVERLSTPEFYRKKDAVDPLCGRFLINRYGKDGNSIELRGETQEALDARIDFDESFSGERLRFYDLIKRFVSKFGFGNFESFVVAFSIAENFIPMRYGWYNRLQFLVSNEPMARELLDFIPTNSSMLGRLHEFSRALVDTPHLNDKLRAFNGAMEEHSFIGGPVFLLDRK